MAEIRLGKNYVTKQLANSIDAFFKNTPENVTISYRDKNNTNKTVTIPNIRMIMEELTEAEEFIFAVDVDLKTVNPPTVDTMLVNRNPNDSNDVSIHLCVDNTTDDNVWITIGSDVHKTGNKGLPAPVIDGPDSTLENVDTDYEIKNYIKDYTYSFETNVGVMTLKDGTNGKLNYNSGSVDDDVDVEVYLTASDDASNSGTTKVDIRVINSSNVVDQELVNYDYLNNEDNGNSNEDFNFGEDTF